MIFILLGLAGSVVCAFGVYIIKRDKRFIRSSTLINGEVVKIIEQSVNTYEGQRTRHIPVVKYFSQGKFWCFEGDDQGAAKFLISGASVKVRIHNENYRLGRLEQDMSGLSGIAYLFVIIGIIFLVLATVLFKPEEFNFSLMTFAPLVAILYAGMMVWPSIARAQQF
jgi:hypothetical protein